MNVGLLLVGLLNLTITGLIIAVCLPLVRGQVKMNRWYGIRIPKSYTSPENWLRINAYGGRALIRWSLPVALIGLVDMIAACFVPTTNPDAVPWVIASSLAGLLTLGAVIQILLWSRHLPGLDNLSGSYSVTNR